MMQFLKRNKVFSILIILTIICFILGFFFYAKLDNNSRDIIKNNIYSLLNEPVSLKDFILNTFLSNLLIWILGISILGIFIVIPLYLFYIFTTSFELCSFISVLGIKYMPSTIIYFIPRFIILICTFILCFYSISFSIYLFRSFFLQKQYNYMIIMKRYIKIFIISFIGLILSSTLQYFIICSLSKLFF